MNYIANAALNYGGFLPDSSIKQRNFRNSNSSSSRPTKVHAGDTAGFTPTNLRKRFANNNNNFNQTTNDHLAWNQQQQNVQPSFYANNNWSKAANQMNQQALVNSSYQLQNTAQFSNLMNNYQPQPSYQPQQQQAQQNLTYYLDSSNYSSNYSSSNANNQLYNSNSTDRNYSTDLNSQLNANQLITNPLNSNQINTFWTSSYYDSNQNNLPINSDGRANNMPVLTVPKCRFTT